MCQDIKKRKSIQSIPNYHGFGMVTLYLSILFLKHRESYTRRLFTSLELIILI